MEADRSIVLQKKMIIFLSAIVIGVFSGLLYIEKNIKNAKKVYVQNIDLITVNISEAENEILREKVRYLAVRNVEKVAQSGEEKSFVEDIVSNEDLLEVENIKEGALIVADLSKNDSEQDVLKEETLKIDSSKENEFEFLKNNGLAEKNKTEDSKAQSVTENASEANGTKFVKYKELAEDNPPTEYTQKIEATATAYCLCKKCCGKSPDNPSYGNTHSGLKIVPGTGIKVIAVDPKVIPLNSKVYVEGLNGAWDYGHAIAADTGSAIKELKIDLYMDTHTEALEWGRRKVNVYLLSE